MLNSKIQQKNREWWEIQVSGLLQRFAKEYAGKTLQDARRESTRLQNCAFWSVADSFDLLMTDHIEQAHQVADYAIEVATEALRIESYAQVFTVHPPTPQQIEIENASGRMLTLMALHYAVWFRTGERPRDLLQQVVDARIRYYSLNNEYFKTTVGHRLGLEDLIMACIEGERFTDALDLYHKDHVDNFEDHIGAEILEQWTGQKLTKDMKFSRSIPRVLAIIAKYKLGRQEFKPVVRVGIESWYEQCLRWGNPSKLETAYWVRLPWAYLRGKYVTGTVELEPLMHELRGY